MVQEIKALETQAWHLSSITKTHLKLDGKNKLQICLLTSLSMLWSTYSHTYYAHSHEKVIFKRRGQMFVHWHKNRNSAVIMAKWLRQWTRTPFLHAQVRVLPTMYCLFKPMCIVNTQQNAALHPSSLGRVSVTAVICLEGCGEGLWWRHCYVCTLKKKMRG